MGLVPGGPGLHLVEAEQDLTGDHLVAFVYEKLAQDPRVGERDGFALGAGDDEPGRGDSAFDLGDCGPGG